MLTDTRIRNAKPDTRPIKLTDAFGLHLLIQPHGSKLWRLAYRFDGKQKTLALGVYPAVGLAHARDGRDEARKLLAQGIDPSALRKTGKRVDKAATESTFQAVAEEMVAKLEREQRAPATISKKRWLLGLAYPAFGNRSVAEITARELLLCCVRSRARGSMRPPSACAAPVAWCSALPSPAAAPIVIHQVTCAAPLRHIV